MHIVCVNHFYDADLTDPEALLDRYTTLTGWAEGLTAAGAQVSVVQRFGEDTTTKRSGIRYHFVRDPTGRPGSLFDWARRLHHTVAALQPDVVHANGLRFGRQAWLLKRRARVPLLLQDHADTPPTRLINRRTLAWAMQQLDGLSFTHKALAQPWLDAGILHPQTPIFELLEGSTRFRLIPREAARLCSGLSGDPLCLWVGRLIPRKDPLTVLEGFARALNELPQAHLAMAYSDESLLPQVQEWLTAHPQAAERVTLLGRKSPAELETIYSSADYFLLGSHYEGSGYALLEALACGVVPIVTDIPAFRRITAEGTVGTLWPTGDAAALARALIEQHHRRQPETRQQIYTFFQQHLSFEAIGRQALDTYRQLMERRQR